MSPAPTLDEQTARIVVDKLVDGRSTTGDGGLLLDATVVAPLGSDFLEGMLR